MIEQSMAVERVDGMAIEFWAGAPDAAEWR
jgi:hypothetical protein